MPRNRCRNNGMQVSHLMDPSLLTTDFTLCGHKMCLSCSYGNVYYRRDKLDALTNGIFMT